MKHHCPGWGPRVRMAVLLMAARILPWHVSTSRAESAQVLPKGVSSASATYYHYFDITERYDPNGKVEDIDANYNANLQHGVSGAGAPRSVFSRRRGQHRAFGGGLQLHLPLVGIRLQLWRHGQVIRGHQCALQLDRKPG